MRSFGGLATGEGSLEGRPDVLVADSRRLTLAFERLFVEIEPFLAQ